MSKMRVVQVTHPKGALELVEREIPEPGAGSVRIKVEACGICHSDSLTKEGTWPGIQYPRVPGHEIAGIIDAVGAGVVGWTRRPTGRSRLARRTLRVLRFLPSRRFRYLPNRAPSSRHRVRRRLRRIHDRSRRRIGADSGRTFSRRGRTADVRRESPPSTRFATAARGPAIWSPYSASAVSATWAFSSPRRWVSGPLPSREGWTRNRWPGSSARGITSTARRRIPRRNWLKLGGAKVILATVTSGEAMSAVLGGLGVNGKLIVLGAAAEPLEVPGIPLIGGRRSIMGWPSGNSIDSQDTLSFSKLTGVRAMTEVFPLERAAEAYEHMMSGKARFRAVLTTGR